MPPGRNGVPTPSGGALRTAERTGKIPVDGTGGTRPRQARPKPAVGQGPFDVDDADPRVSSAPGVLDFGALRVPVPPAGQVTVEPSANGRMQAVHVNLAGGRLSVSALAAPKSSKLWPQLAKEIDASLREGGARVRSFKGEWGRELHATTGAATSVFVGVDGPRWMIYGVATGPTGENPELDAELRRMLRGTVVVRGKSPYPVRTVLPLTTPAELGGTDEPVTTAVPTTPPAPAAPAPDRRRAPSRAPVEEPAWADPVQRISDASEDEVLPEGDDAAAATGLTTSAWPVDERTGRPRAPEWTGEQRVPPRRPKAPPVAEVAAAITEPILISAVMGEPSAPPHDEPVRDTPRRGRNRPAEVEPPVTTRLPVVPDVPAAGAEAPPDPATPARPETGIDAYFGWDRSARPEPALERPAPERSAPDRPAPDRPAPDRPAPDRPAPDRPARERSAPPAPVDPLDPSAPVDTRWLDEPGITTAWESVTAGLAAEPDRPEPARPAPAQEPAAGQDWAEWARQELDRAVSGRSGSTETEQVPSSFWDRYGLQEPPTGGRASRRHSSGPEDEHGRDGRDHEIDPFTARRRSRQATQGRDPDAPARPRRSADPADVTELPSRTGRVHHLHEPGSAGIGDDLAGGSARSIWEDMSANRAPGLHGGDDAAPRSRAEPPDRDAAPDRGLRPGRASETGARESVERSRHSGGSSASASRAAFGDDVWPGGADAAGRAGRGGRSSAADRPRRAGRSTGSEPGTAFGDDVWSGGAQQSDRTGRAGRSGRSEPDGQDDAWSGGAHPFAPADRVGRSTTADRSADTGPAGRGVEDDRAARSGWADLSRAANAIGRAGRADPTEADRTHGGEWAGLTGSSTGGSRNGGADPLGDRAPFATAPPAGETERSGSADPFGWTDRSARPGASSPAARSDRTRERPHRTDPDGPDRALPRRAAAEPPPSPSSSPWGPAASDPWSAVSSGGSATAGWTTGWPGTGPSGRRAEEPAHERPAPEPAGGGRRRAEDGGGSSRLSVAELAQRAAREASTTRRSRHTRPGGDRGE